MSFKSQFYWAYVAGLAPFHVMREEWHDSHQYSPPAPIRDQPAAALPRKLSRRKHAAVLFIAAFGLTIGAWQLLSPSDASASPDVSGQASSFVQHSPRG